MTLRTSELRLLGYEARTNVRGETIAVLIGRGETPGEYFVLTWTGAVATDLTNRLTQVGQPHAGTVSVSLNTYSAQPESFVLWEAALKRATRIMKTWSDRGAWSTTYFGDAQFLTAAPAVEPPMSGEVVGLYEDSDAAFAERRRRMKLQQQLKS